MMSLVILMLAFSTSMLVEGTLEKGVNQVDRRSEPGNKLPPRYQLLVGGECFWNSSSSQSLCVCVCVWEVGLV